MKIRHPFIILLAIFATVSACIPLPGTAAPPTISGPAPTSLPPTIPMATSTPTFAPIYTPGGGGCEIVADRNVVIYERPSVASGLFGTLAAGDRVPAAAFTADGWIGFDPGVAQAANVGVFRNRWVQTGATFHLEGDCDGLPLVVGPPAGICFLMAETDTPVYAGVDTSTAVIATMHLGDYAKAIGRATGWFKVDLNVGSMGLDLEGWIAEELANLNGPCDSLPALTP